jgi:BolA family transcriptional regulator, general stress-responsive regulator
MRAEPDLRDLLRERINAALAPESVEVADDSALHAGHPGATGGGHYRVRVVAERFRGLRQLARHRLVYAAAGELLAARVHALQIEALDPQEAAAIPCPDSPSRGTR